MECSNLHVHLHPACGNTVMALGDMEHSGHMVDPLQDSGLCSTQPLHST